MSTGVESIEANTDVKPEQPDINPTEAATKIEAEEPAPAAQSTPADSTDTKQAPTTDEVTESGTSEPASETAAAVAETQPPATAAEEAPTASTAEEAPTAPKAEEAPTASKAQEAPTALNAEEAPTAPEAEEAPTVPEAAAVDSTVGQPEREERPIAVPETAEWVQVPPAATDDTTAVAETNGAVHGATPSQVAPVVVETKTSAKDYLEETVVPVLREGLRELVRIRPEDPYAFMSDFFKNYRTASK